MTKKRNDKKFITRCVRCGKDMEAYRSRKKYCSDCRKVVNAEMAKQSYLNKKRNRKKEDRYINCAICGKRIKATGIANLKYCSDECRAIVQKRYKEKYKSKYPERIKEKNKTYYWKNRDKDLKQSKEYQRKNRKLISKHKKKYHSKKYFDGKWETVLKRDNRTCQSCGSREKLIVHHKDGINIFNGVPNNDLDNLITLCRDCHNKIHFTKDESKKVAV
jgi:ribosomal protein L37E